MDVVVVFQFILVPALIILVTTAALLAFTLYWRCGGLWANRMKCFVNSNTMNHEALGWAKSAPVLSILKKEAFYKIQEPRNFENFLVVTLPVEIKVSSSKKAAEITVRGISNQTAAPVFVWTSNVSTPSCKGNTYAALGGERPFETPNIQENQNLFKVDTSNLKKNQRFEGEVHIKISDDATLAVVHIGLFHEGRWLEDRADVLLVKSLQGSVQYTDKILNENSKMSKSFCFQDN